MKVGDKWYNTYGKTSLTILSFNEAYVRVRQEYDSNILDDREINLLVEVYLSWIRQPDSVYDKSIIRKKKLERILNEEEKH